MKLGHIHLKVTDLERARRFYTELLGWQVTELVGSHYCFLSADPGETHHHLALQAIGGGAPKPASNAIGLYHVAFELFSESALHEAIRWLEEQKISHSSVDHGISWAIYFSDPDGNGIELYIDRRHAPGGRRLWLGRSAPL